MRSFKKKAAALILIITALSLAVPYYEFNQVYAASHITDASKMDAYDYTSSPELAGKLTQVFEGNIGLHKNGINNSQTKAPLGCSKLTGSNKFYIKNKTTGSATFGWQCYIYANAVYNTLFNEWAGNGSSLKNSKIVISKESTFSYKQFVSAGVKVGAYVRTTANKNGSYHRSKAHSFIILGYNEEYVTYVDGNSDGRGLVRVNKVTWKELNKSQTTGIGRRICHIIQPTDKYFDSLYGVKKAVSGSSKTDSAAKNSEAASSGTVADPDKIKVSFSRNLSYSKSKTVLSGNDVLYLQTELKYLGYTVSTNAKYDSATAEAVKKFQKDKKLTADGKTGSQTWKAIESAVKAKKNSLCITKQPSDVKTSVGKNVEFSVKASGSKLTYKWYYKKSGDSKWNLWKGHETATTSATANNTWNKMQVYCVVTDGNGNTVKSSAATVTLSK